MARGEDQAQPLVTNVVVHGCLEVLDLPICPTLRLHVAAEFRMLAFEHASVTKVVDGAALGRRHQPRGRFVGNAGLRPGGERRHQRVLSQVLGSADVAYDPGKPGDQPGSLHAEYGLGRPVRLGCSHRTEYGARPRPVNMWKGIRQPVDRLGQPSGPST